MKTKIGTTKCNLNDILFPVELRDNPRNTNREYSKVVTGIIDNKEIDLNYCSPVYELVNNSDIFPKVEKIFKQQGIAYTAKYSQANNCRFYGDFIIEDQRFAYHMQGTNDLIKFIFNFQHSYNGLVRYRGVAGFYRLVCTNGLTIPVKEMNEYNLVLEGKHTASILHSLQEFESILFKITNNIGVVKSAITAKYELLGGRWVANPLDRIEEVLGANKIAILNDKRLDTIGYIMDRINIESTDVTLGYNGKVNDFLIWNGINRYINDDKLNIANPEKRREVDSKVLEFMLVYP